MFSVRATPHLERRDGPRAVAESASPRRSRGFCATLGGGLRQCTESARRRLDWLGGLSSESFVFFPLLLRPFTLSFFKLTSMYHHASRYLALSAFSLALLSGVSAQTAPAPKLEFPAPSPAASFKQRVGLTDIEVSYSRPSVKGRQIFGGLLPYGQVWRTGANSATKIKFSTPVKLNGTAIPAGNYELFTIPEAKEWTVIIHKDSSDWGAYAYDAKNDVARIKATPTATPNLVETFAIGVADLRDESATLYLTWEKVRVPVKLEVDVTAVLVPQIEAAMASDAAKKPYAQAALLYLEHNLDLTKAATWMDAAIAENPKAFYYNYHKGRILAKQGNKAGAIAAAQKTIEAANLAGGAIRDEYVRLSEALIASLR